MGLAICIQILWHMVTGYTNEYIDTASIPSSVGPEVAIIKHLTSVRLAAADFADLDLPRALDPAMCRGMYQSK